MVGPFLPRRDLLAAQSVLDDQDQQRQQTADDWLKSAMDRLSNPFGQQPAAPAPMPMAPAATPMAAVAMPQAPMPAPAPQPAAQPSLERVADDWLKSAWEKVNSASGLFLNPGTSALPAGSASGPADTSSPVVSQAPASSPTQIGDVIPWDSGTTSSTSAQPSASSDGNPTTDEVTQFIRQEAAKRGIDPDVALRVADSEGGREAARRGTFATGSSWWPFQLHYGGKGYENLGDTAGMGNDFTAKTGWAPGDPRAWKDATTYALDQVKAGGWDKWYGAAKQGIKGFMGVGETPNSTAQFGNSAPSSQGAPAVAMPGGQSGAQPVARNTAVPNQFGDQTLTAAEAYAACGPAAAAALAGYYGNRIPLKDALEAAKQVGWSEGGGMNGIGNQKRLMDALGVPAELDPTANRQRMVADASAGKVVTISTPGHYFSADGYDAQSGKFHVGASGTALRGGSEWMSLDEMQARMGAINGALFTDPSKEAAAGDWMQQAAEKHGVELPGNQVPQQIAQAQQKAGLPEAPKIPGALEQLSQITKGVGDAFGQVGNAIGQGAQAVGSALTPQAGPAPMTNAQRMRQTQAPLDQAASDDYQKNPGTADQIASGIGQTAQNIPLPMAGNKTAAEIGAGWNSLNDLTGGKSEAYPTGGPLAGPAVGATRQQAGYEQKMREAGVLDEYQALQDEASRAYLHGERLSPAKQARLNELEQIARSAQRVDSSTYEAAQRNPDIQTYEALGGIAQALPATALAPGVEAGLAKNVAATALDPGNIVGNAGGALLGKAVGAGGRAAEAARPGTSLADSITPRPYGPRGQSTEEIGQSVRATGDYPWGETAPAGAVAREAEAPTDAPLAPTFYSQAQRVLEQKMPNRAVGNAVQAILKNSGVKPEELKWTGLDDFLAENASTPLTKQDVLSFLKQNEVQIQEVTKGADPRPHLSGPETERYYDLVGREAGDHGAPLAPDEVAELERLSHRMEASGGPTPSGATRYSKYTLPGGENYRELLLTLPEHPSAGRFTQDAEAATEAAYQQIEAAGLPRNATAYQLSQHFGAAEAARLNEARMGITDVAAPERPSYHSSHWKEPNILAHVRFADHVDANDGKKVLLLEEVQSDWHQAGRKQGYQGQHEARLAELKKESAEIESALGRTFDAAEQDRLYARGAEVSRELSTLEAQGSRGVVPDAPFSKTWPELAFKRMVRYAAENGYDRIAWAPGQVHAERYDLAKQVESVRYNPDNGLLVAQGTDGRSVLRQESVPREKVPEYIGNEAADKLFRTTPSSDGWLDLSGVDLKMGGEGMKGFYDKMLPEVAGKVVKKWGAKVREARITTNKMEESWVVYDRMGDRVGTYADEATAQDWVRAHPQDDLVVAKSGPEWGKTKAEQTVHAIDVTPEMKRSVLSEGQPLFFRPELGGAAVGAYGGYEADPNASPSDRMRNAALGAAGGAAVMHGAVRVGGALAAKGAATVKAGPASSANETLRKIGAMYDEDAKLGAPNVAARLEAWRKDFVRQITDRNVDVNEFQQKAAKIAGRPLRADEMLSQITSLAPDPAAAIKIQEGLKPAIQAVGKDQSWLSTYLTLVDNVDTAAAKNNAARKFSGGITVAESEQAIKDMTAELGPERMKAIEDSAQQVWDFGKSLLQRKVEAGIITQDNADLLTTMYPHYSPTVITDFLKDPARIATGKSINVRSTGIKAASVEGTERLREDPLASFVRAAYETEGLAHQNEAFNAFVKLREMDPELKTFIQEIPDAATLPRGFQRVTGFVDGVRQSYSMPQAMANVVQGAATSSTTGWLGTAWRGMMNTFRSATTTRNPTFLASNAIMDAITFGLRESVNQGGPQNFPKVMAELIPAYLDAFKGLGKGEFRGDTARYLKAGGGQAGYFTGSAEDARKTVQELSRSNAISIESKGDLLRVAKDILTLKPIEAIGERIELAPRVAAMRLAEKRGENSVQAVIRGRSTTMDFSKGGELSKAINGFIPFFNVGIQSPVQLARTMRQNPVAFTTTAAALVGGPVVAAEAWNRSDPQRARDYEDVPQYLKDMGVVVMLPVAPNTDAQGNRKPQFVWLNLREWAPFAVAAREAAGRVMGQEPRDWGEMIGAETRSISPIQATSGADAATGFIPLGVSTAAQLAFNKDAFRNSQIATKGNDEQATETSKRLTSGINAATGAQIRPSQTEFAIRDLGTGVAGAALAAGDMALGAAQKDKRPQNAPGIGGLYGRFVKDSTGEELSNLRNHPLPIGSEHVTKAMQAVGMNYPPVPQTVTYGDVPIDLTQAEQRTYYEALGKYMAQYLGERTAAPEWSGKSAANRKATIELYLKNARDRAEAETIRSIPQEERGRRRTEVLKAKKAA